MPINKDVDEFYRILKKEPNWARAIPVEWWQRTDPELKRMLNYLESLPDVKRVGYGAVYEYRRR